MGETAQPAIQDINIGIQERQLFRQLPTGPSGMFPVLVGEIRHKQEPKNCKTKKYIKRQRLIPPEIVFRKHLITLSGT